MAEARENHPDLNATPYPLAPYSYGLNVISVQDRGILSVQDATSLHRFTVSELSCGEPHRAEHFWAFVRAKALNIERQERKPGTDIWTYDTFTPRDEESVRAFIREESNDFHRSMFGDEGRSVSMTFVVKAEGQRLIRKFDPHSKNDLTKAHHMMMSSFQFTRRDRDHWLGWKSYYRRDR